MEEQTPHTVECPLPSVECDLTFLAEVAARQVGLDSDIPEHNGHILHGDMDIIDTSVCFVDVCLDVSCSILGVDPYIPNNKQNTMCS